MERYPTKSMMPPQIPATMAMVPREEATLIRKIKTITQAGKNVEIKRDRNGNLKVYKVSKEIT